MNKQTVSLEQIMKIASHRSQPSVSIYIPTERMGAGVMTSHIHLRNMLVTAENQLVQGGLRPTLARDFLKPATALVGDANFWNVRTDAVALFIGNEFFKAYHLPFSTEQFLHVGEAFNVRPLLPALSGCQYFNVLALDENHVRLVRCTPYGADEAVVEKMPESLDSFFAMDYSEKQLQLHSAGPAGRAGGQIGHGAGDKGADKKERQHQFCIAIDNAITAHLRASEEPLVLAGTEEILDAYRAVNEYPHLLSDAVVGSPKMLKDDDLKARAQPIADNFADEPRLSAIERYKARADTHLASQRIEDIVPAAHQGKVDALLITGKPVWGHYDPESGKLSVHTERVTGEDDLVNLAIVETLHNHGSAYMLHSGDLDQTSMAALYRY